MTTPVKTNVTCPFCRSNYIIRRRKLTTPAMLVLLFGIFLAPVCLGLVMIPIAFAMREDRFFCEGCRRFF